MAGLVYYSSASGNTERFMQGNILRWQIRTLGAAGPGWELMLPGAETWCIHPLSP